MADQKLKISSQNFNENPGFFWVADYEKSWRVQKLTLDGFHKFDLWVKFRNNFKVNFCLETMKIMEWSRSWNDPADEDIINSTCFMET